MGLSCDSSFGFLNAAVSIAPNHLNTFFSNSGMDQLAHLDSKKSTPGSHWPDIWVGKYNILNILLRMVPWPDIWVQKTQYPECFGANGAQIIILVLRTSYYNSLLVEQSMILNRRSDDGKKSRKFDFKTKHFRWSRLLLLLLHDGQNISICFSVRCVEDLMRMKSLKRSLGGKFLLGETRKLRLKEIWNSMGGGRNKCKKMNGLKWAFKGSWPWLSENESP